jgi:hypothetical protein
MIRLGSLLVFVASIGFVSVTEAPYADDAMKNDECIVIAIYRSAGFTSAERTQPIHHYRFTVVNDGSWELTPLKGEAQKGKLGADDLEKWVKDIEDGGLSKVESNPMLGALDEPYMDITVNTREKKTRVRIPLAEKLSQAIEKKIVELVKPSG